MVQSSPRETKLGDAFPPPTSSQDLAYLGLSEGKPFTLGDIQADLLVLELLNIYCTSCQKQAPIFNEVSNLVERDPVMKGRIKWLGVGVGNNAGEVELLSIPDGELLKKVKAGMALPGAIVEEIHRIPPEAEYLYAGKVEVKGEEIYTTLMKQAYVK